MTLELFKQLLQANLEELAWKRAEQLYADLGPELADPLATLLHHAAGKDKIYRVLEMVSDHHYEHGADPDRAKDLFRRILRNELSIEPQF